MLIFDIEKVGVYTFALGRIGRTAITVLVDDPGHASRVDVLIGEQYAEKELTSVAGHPLFPVATGPESELATADELNLILFGHDLPLSRLAAAIKLIATAPAARPVILESRIDQIVEWSRWLSFRASIEDARQLGKSLCSELAGWNGSVPDTEVLRLAEAILAKFISR